MTENTQPKQVATSVSSMASFAQQQKLEENARIQTAYEAYKKYFAEQLSKDGSAVILTKVQMETKFIDNYNLHQEVFKNVNFSNPQKFSLIEMALADALLEYKLQGLNTKLDQVIQHFDTACKGLSEGLKQLSTRLTVLEQLNIHVSDDQGINTVSGPKERKAKKTHKQKVAEAEAPQQNPLETHEGELNEQY
jgi:hypothetical protein